MNERARRARQVLRARRYYEAVTRRWRLYRCSCGQHNMRGDR